MQEKKATLNMHPLKKFLKKTKRKMSLLNCHGTKSVHKKGTEFYKGKLLYNEF